MAGPPRSNRSTITPQRFVDTHVGRRVSDRRRELLLSRGQLAEALGISPEQVRRYESGRATIVASRLYAIAQLLGVPASHFFEGIAAPAPAARPIATVGPSDPELRRIIEAFWAIGDRDARGALITLIEAIAESTASLGPSPTRLE